MAKHRRTYAHHASTIARRLPVFPGRLARRATDMVTGPAIRYIHAAGTSHAVERNPPRVIGALASRQSGVWI
jgi:hypothetical protein